MILWFCLLTVTDRRINFAENHPARICFFT
jgi:hypothetical protein